MYIFTKRLSNFSLGKANVEDMFEDGRFCSMIAEQHIPHWFPDLNLRFSKGVYRTYVDDTNVSYIVRIFGSTLRFMPSDQVGKGRTYSYPETWSKAKDMILISCAFEYPKVHIRFDSLRELLKIYPDAIIPAQDKDSFIGTAAITGQESAAA